MFDRIKHFFDTHIKASEQGECGEGQLRVATVALLMEMLHAEAKCGDKKTELTQEIIEQTFRLTEDQTAFLMAIGEEKRRQATDFFEFTHLINDGYTREQKIQLLENLWKIAYLDGHLDIEEDYLVDKIARLITIPRTDVLLAKNRAQGDR